MFSYLNWWALEDLRAEIREETSNNRVKSGYEDRWSAPIDKVPDAGADEGFANAMEPVEDKYAESSRAKAAASPYLRRNDSTKSDATVTTKKPVEGRALVSPSRTSSMSSNDYDLSVVSTSS